MHKFTLSTKSKRIIFAGLSVAFYIAGVASYPTIDRTYKFTADLFFPAPIAYQAPLSDYEKDVLANFNSVAHQAACLAQSRATVSLEYVQKYLKETKKQQVLAQYELPLSLVGE